MSYERRNRDLQNVFGVIAGLLLAGIGTFLFLIRIVEEGYVSNEIVNPIIFFAGTLFAGSVIGIIAFRKDGIIIGAIISPVVGLTCFLYRIIIIYDPSAYLC